MALVNPPPRSLAPSCRLVDSPRGVGIELRSMASPPRMCILLPPSRDNDFALDDKRWVAGHHPTTTIPHPTETAPIGPTCTNCSLKAAHWVHFDGAGKWIKGEPCCTVPTVNGVCWGCRAGVLNLALTQAVIDTFDTDGYDGRVATAKTNLVAVLNAVGASLETAKIFDQGDIYAVTMAFIFHTSLDHQRIESCYAARGGSGPSWLGISGFIDSMGGDERRNCVLDDNNENVVIAAANRCYERALAYKAAPCTLFDLPQYLPK